jgi:TPP-dependent indolepyruvate ferredoxin oxidoreductase alpha subunit
LTVVSASRRRRNPERALAYLCFVGTERAAAIIFVAASCGAFAILVVVVAADPA